jgi:hypothetical protein
MIITNPNPSNLKKKSVNKIIQDIKWMV